MDIYFEPINLNHWDMFTEVNGIGHIETFCATKSMKIGNIILLYVTRQQKPVKCGIYSFGIAVTEPYAEPDGSGLVIDAEIVRISYNKPLIDEAVCKEVFAQVRSVHRVADKQYDSIVKMLNQ